MLLFSFTPPYTNDGWYAVSCSGICSSHVIHSQWAIIMIKVPTIVNYQNANNLLPSSVRRRKYYHSIWHCIDCSLEQKARYDIFLHYSKSSYIKIVCFRNQNENKLNLPTKPIILYQTQIRLPG